MQLHHGDSPSHITELLHNYSCHGVCTKQVSMINTLTVSSTLVLLDLEQQQLQNQLLTCYCPLI